MRLEPAQREAWLRRACGEDEDLRAEVSRLLTQDKRADGDRFLTPPESAGGSPDRTGSWPPRDDLRPSGGPEPDDHAAALSIDNTNCFFPKAAIAAPFDEADGLEAMIAHARDPVMPPSQLQAGIPEDLEHVVLRCLAKDPSNRFPDADTLDRALGECACATEWDLSRAARWWRSASRSPAMFPIAL